jgi:hypothetical protein
MLHEYAALNQDIDDKNEIVQMKNHHDVQNNNRWSVTMYNDVEKFLYKKKINFLPHLLFKSLTAIQLNQSIIYRG